MSKRIFLSILLVVGAIVVKAQNNWELTSHSGTNITLKNFIPNFSPPKGQGFLGVSWWDRQVFFTQSIGLAYETNKYSILGTQHSSSFELGFTARNIGGNKGASALYLYQDLYIPKKWKENKLRLIWGIRNSILLVDNLMTEEFFENKRYVLGLNLLLRYELNANMRLGLKSYLGLSPYRASEVPDTSFFNDVQFRNMEFLLCFSYQLNQKVSNED